MYARNGKYKEALQAWEKKLPMTETDMEKAWLYHEIGRCHLELGNYDKAIENGKKSLDCAERLSDENSSEKLNWTINAIVLIGQSKSKLDTVEELSQAIEYFERAISIAEKQSKSRLFKIQNIIFTVIFLLEDDKQAVAAITKVLNECKDKLKKRQLQDKAPTPEIKETPKQPTPKQPTPSPSPSPSPPPVQQSKPESPVSDKGQCK